MWADPTTLRTPVGAAEKPHAPLMGGVDGGVVAAVGDDNGGELHNLLDKVVSVGTALGLNSSDHNVNTITNGDGMPRMRTFRETIFPK
ncbi:hypothetical protein Tco_1433526 [Tanacetum coccineum]